MIVFTNSTVVLNSRKIILTNKIPCIAKTRGLIELAIRNMVKSLCTESLYPRVDHISRDNHQHNLRKTDHATVSQMQRKKEYHGRNNKRSKGNPKGARKREVRFIVDEL